MSTVIQLQKDMEENYYVCGCDKHEKGEDCHALEERRANYSISIEVKRGASIARRVSKFDKPTIISDNPQHTIEVVGGVLFVKPI